MTESTSSVSLRPDASTAPPRYRALALAVGAAFSLPQLAYGQAVVLPTGMSVRSGVTTFSYPNATTLKADQSTLSSAVNFTTFNTSANASVIIAQPTGGRALYRVDNPVQFFGRLSANGQVFLSSPTGVYFAPGANIDVGGLVATTLSMKQEDFEAGRNIWSNVGATGKV